MATGPGEIAVYLEAGQKRTIAGALEWPGWCRVGRDADSALRALAESAPRYAAALRDTPLAFAPPADPAAYRIVERVAGTATTDFGAPDIAPAADRRPFGDDDLQRAATLLRACWRAFDAAVDAAAGKTLRTGPRGGGRPVEGIVEHTLGAEASYLGRLAWKFRRGEGTGPEEREHLRRAVLDALAAAARGELPALGPRGGTLWSPRYFTRRAGWHVLDHAWEIEDRIAD